MKTILLALGLCFSFASLPASAGPFDLDDASIATREEGPALQIDHRDLARRAPGPAPWVTSTARRVQATPPAWGRLQAGPRLLMDSPRRLSVVAGVPEPTAVTLFAVGVLLAVQAIPRKSRLEESDAAESAQI